jgi:hypothetical protein
MALGTMTRQTLYFPLHPAAHPTPHWRVCRYRLTPLNVTELAEKDTGDAAGDLGFLLMTLQKLVTCTPEQANTDECFLAFEPTIRQYFVETVCAHADTLRVHAQCELPLPSTRVSCEAGVHKHALHDSTPYVRLRLHV